MRNKNIPIPSQFKRDIRLFSTVSAEHVTCDFQGMCGFRCFSTFPRSQDLSKGVGEGHTK